MRPIEALIFDVDGTLYHQGPLRRAMFRRLLAAHLLHPMRGLSTVRVLQAYRRAQEALRVGNSVEQDLANMQVQLASRWTGASRRVVLDTVNRWMENEPLQLLRGTVRQGLHALLEDARKSGLRLGVFSDYPAAEKLRALGLDGFFDAVICAQDEGVQRFKPDPRGLLAAARRLDVDAADAAYVGDRPEVDGLAAARAGMKFIGVKNNTALPGLRHFLEEAQLEAAQGCRP